MSAVQTEAAIIVRRVKRDHPRLVASVGALRLYRDALDIAKLRIG